MIAPNRIAFVLERGMNGDESISMDVVPVDGKDLSGL
jgi:hypothetical protein